MTVALLAGLALFLTIALFLQKLTRLGPAPVFALSLVAAAFARDYGLLGEWQPPFTDSHGRPVLPFFVAFLGLPLVYFSGRSLGQRRHEARRALPRGLLSCVARILFLGALSYALLPWEQVDFGDNAYRAAFLIGAVWTLVDPRDSRTRTDPGGADVERQWSVLIALCVLALLREWWLSEASPFSERALALYGTTLGVSVVSGINGGFWSWLISRLLRRATSRITTAIIGCSLALLPALPLGGDLFISVWIAGALPSFLDSRRGLETSHGRQPLTDNARELFDGYYLVIGVVGFFSVGLLFPGVLSTEHIGPVIGLWALGLVVHALISVAVPGLGLGGPQGMRGVRDALELYPGVLALLALPAAGAMALMGKEYLASAEVVTILLQVLLLGLLIQGSVASFIPGARRRRDHRRWERLEGKRLALERALEALHELRRDGEIREELGDAMEIAFVGQRRRLATEREELCARDARVNETRWRQALGQILEDARQAIVRAQLSGRVSGEIAEELIDELMRQRRRAGELRIDELLWKDESENR